jgi:hypothetical protein
MNLLQFLASAIVSPIANAIAQNANKALSWSARQLEGTATGAAIAQAAAPVVDQEADALAISAATTIGNAAAGGKL